MVGPKSVQLLVPGVLWLALLSQGANADSTTWQNPQTPPSAVPARLSAHDVHADIVRARIIWAHDVHAETVHAKVIQSGEGEPPGGPPGRDRPGGPPGRDINMSNVQADELDAHDIHARVVEADVLYAHHVETR